MTRLLSLLLLTYLLTSCETVSQIDSALYEQIDKVSKEDTVTGVRSLNLKGDEGGGMKNRETQSQRFQLRFIGHHELTDLLQIGRRNSLKMWLS